MTYPPTRKLFWADPYRRRFTARVLRRLDGERPGIVLNRTLFYPTGGGQPHDTGWLGDRRVLEVETREGLIVHILDQAPAPEAEITGEIDWPRRWDHMQQHSGQHLLSAALLDLFQRPTVSFHLGEDSVTIDIPGPALAPTELADLLDFTQAVIADDRPILSYIVAPEDIAAVPLRKPPTVDGPVRIVEIEGLDWSACGGTHVRSTAAIGAIMVTRQERRGDLIRIHFVCGARAQQDHFRRLAVTQALGEQLTTGLEDIPPAVGRLQEEFAVSQKALRKAQAQLADAEAIQLWSGAPSIKGVSIVSHILHADDPKALNRMMSTLLEHEHTVAVLGWAGARPRWMAACSSDLNLDLQALLPAVRSVPGARGGGRSDFIQGGAPDLPALESVLQTLQAELSGILERTP